MATKFQRWKKRRRLKRLIKAATRIIYSEESDFDGVVSQLTHRHKDAKPEEIYVAIQAVIKIEEQFQALVHSKDEIRDKDVVNDFINNALSVLDEITEEDDDEIISLKTTARGLKAEIDFQINTLAFEALRDMPQDEFPGIVYKASKLVKGPISIHSRKTFKRLTEQMHASDAKVKELDAELEFKKAEIIVGSFFDLFLAESENELMDASLLPYARDDILDAAEILTRHLTKMETNDPTRFEQQQYDELLNAAQTLYADLMFFYNIEPSDKEAVADLNENWQKIQDKIENNEASESDYLWMERAKDLKRKYELQ